MKAKADPERMGCFFCGRPARPSVRVPGVSLCRRHSNAVEVPAGQALVVREASR